MHAPCYQTLNPHPRQPQLALIDGACAVWEPGSNRLVAVDRQSSPDSRPMEITCVWGACAGRPPVPAPVIMQQGDDLADCTIVVPGFSSSPPASLGAGGRRLVLTGAAPQLGEWDPEKGVVLKRQPASAVRGFAAAAAAASPSREGVRPVEEEEHVWAATVRLPLNKLIEAKVRRVD